MIGVVNILNRKIVMKIDNIVIRGASLNDELHWVVYVYDNSGNELERKRFTDWADAGGICNEA